MEVEHKKKNDVELKLANVRAQLRQQGKFNLFMTIARV